MDPVSPSPVYLDHTPDSWFLEVNFKIRFLSSFAAVEQLSSRLVAMLSGISLTLIFFLLWPTVVARGEVDRSGGVQDASVRRQEGEMKLIL
jgi:hypothetical protein